jgi:hypothetical protein
MDFCDHGDVETSSWLNDLPAEGYFFMAWFDGLTVIPHTYEKGKGNDLLRKDSVVYRKYIWKFELSLSPVGSVSSDSFKLVASSFD